MTQSDSRVLVVAAHPDDEILGCGGVVALHAEAGAAVTSFIMCQGRPDETDPSQSGLVRDARNAARTLGVEDVRFGNMPDQKLDTLPLTSVITPLEALVDDVRPDVVYCQFGGDVNMDHRILFDALLVAIRPISSDVRAVLAFDTASSTEWAYPRSFVPDTWVDISSVLDRKLAALACYASEMRDYPHPRSIDAVANKARAWGNQVAVDAAEVFVSVRRTLRNGETPV